MSEKRDKYTVERGGAFAVLNQVQDDGGCVQETVWVCSGGGVGVLKVAGRMH